MGGVDLHTHTTCSDGTLAPRELVREAVRRGVRVLAITDHDSTDGLAEAQEEARKHPPLTIVPGLELNCDIEGSEIHVLGYFIEYEAEWVQDFLRAQRAERVARIYRITERLAALGMPIDPTEILALASAGAPGRPHVAQMMVKHGYVRSVQEAFDKYLGARGAANAPRRRLVPTEAVALIRRAGGVPVLAHPGPQNRDELIPDLVRAGLMGIEVYYPTHSTSQVARYLEVCRTFDLVATGGSDYHGPKTHRSDPPGTPAVPVAVWEALKTKALQVRIVRRRPADA